MIVLPEEQMNSTFSNRPAQEPFDINDALKAMKAFADQPVLSKVECGPVAFAGLTKLIKEAMQQKGTAGAKETFIAVPFHGIPIVEGLLHFPNTIKFLDQHGEVIRIGIWLEEEGVLTLLPEASK